MNDEYGNGRFHGEGVGECMYDCYTLVRLGVSQEGSEVHDRLRKNNVLRLVKHRTRTSPKLPTPHNNTSKDDIHFISPL